jgi:Colon cancer-associated protein Mic1-like
VLSDSQELARILVTLGSSESKRQHNNDVFESEVMHYEPAY